MHWRWFSTAIIAALISGCTADYLNHLHSVTLAADDATRSNVLLQTVDPFYPNSQNTHIEGDQQRIAGVVGLSRSGYRATRSAKRDVVNIATGDDHPCNLENQRDS